MRVLNLLCGGGTGGIEVQCLEHGKRSGLDHRYLILWKPGEISQEMEAAGLNVEVYNTNPKRYLSDFFRFIKKCKSEKIDVLVCHQVAPLITLYILGMRVLLPRIKIIGYAHSNAHDWSKLDRVLRKVVYHYAENVICISKSVQESVKNIIGCRNKLILIYNGVNTEKYSECVHKFNEHQLELVFVGRLYPEKGVDNILFGLSQLSPKIPFRFRIAGDGPQRKELEALCTTLGIRNSVEFLGICRNIPQLFRHTDIFIHMPNWEEGFGLTIVEAMAAGLICIGNSRGAIPEIIQDVYNGYIVNERQSLATILKEIWAGNYPIDAIRENAKNTAIKYDILLYAQKIDELIVKAVMSSSE